MEELPPDSTTFHESAISHLPPELIEQIILYLTSSEALTCIDTDPKFDVLTKKLMRQTIIRATPVYEFSVDENAMINQSVGCYVDYRDGIRELLHFVVCDYSPIEWAKGLKVKIKDEPLEELDSFGRYIRETPWKEITTERSCVELLKLIDMSSFESARDCFISLCCQRNPYSRSSHVRGWFDFKTDRWSVWMTKVKVY